MITVFFDKKKAEDSQFEVAVNSRGSGPVNSVSRNHVLRVDVPKRKISWSPKKERSTEFTFRVIPLYYKYLPLSHAKLSFFMTS